ncbi:MAG: GNAT family N-acetyltransferase [Verrucomicrobiales bacterium]|nr:GNAT family N-acetyltransferase [Verrucomicrobiales bacterium]
MSTLDRFQLEVVDTVPAEALALIDAGLSAHNAAAAPLEDVQPLGCLARSDSGEVMGGALGRRWGECCEIQMLWVHEAHRGRGVGRRLVRAFESAARHRGCTLCYLETLSFQAPQFYLRLGYEIGLRLAGFPRGIEKFVMTRRL